MHSLMMLLVLAGDAVAQITFGEIRFPQVPYPPRPLYPGFPVQQQSGFAGQQPGSPGQQPGLPGQQSGFPGQQSGFPGQQLGFPGQQPGFPGQQPGFPGQQPGFSEQHPGLPGQQPGFPGQQSGFLGQQPGFPGQQPGFPGQQSGFLGQQPGLPEQQPGFPVPQPLSPGGPDVHSRRADSQYHFSWRHSNQTYSWEDAKAYCQNLAGRWQALSIETHDENNWVKSVLERETQKYIWTSGRSNLHPNFFWGTGERVANLDWSHTGSRRSHQPDNAENNIEDCLAVLNNFYSDGIRWHDVACYHLKPVICELRASHFR